MLTKDEERQFVALAKKIEPVMSAEVFNAVAEKFVLNAIELLIYRKGEKGLEVFLTRRPESDAHWAGLWHNPGTIVRASDYVKVDAGKDLMNIYRLGFERLEKKELGAKLTSARFLGNHFLHSLRGRANAMIFLCEMENASDMGEYFLVDDLPKDIVGITLELIKISAKNYGEKRD